MLDAVKLAHIVKVSEEKMTLLTGEVNLSADAKTREDMGADVILLWKLKGRSIPVCERESWNYQNRAKVDLFFAQVWNPLHDVNEEPSVCKKVVTEMDV